MSSQLFKSNSKTFKKSIFLFALAVLAILSVVFIDTVILNVSLLEEGRPYFSFIYLIRTLLIVLGSWLFTVGMINLGNPRARSSYRQALRQYWSNWGVVTWSSQQQGKKIEYSRTLKELIIVAALLLSAFFIFIFLTKPTFFARLRWEDGVVEMLSTLFLFLACAVFFYLFLFLSRSKTKHKLVKQLVALGFSGIFFVIAMEEISWFQRVFDIETPASFAGNAQNETNFHNFASNLFENLYYFASFVFLIVFPFVKEKISFLKSSNLQLFLPGHITVFLGSICVAYNYDMWNVLFTQLSFFVTLFILFDYWQVHKSLKERPVVLGVILAFILTQAIFLIFGNQFIYNNDVTEYKELFIPIVYFCYSLEVLHCFKEASWKKYPKMSLLSDH